MILVRYDTVQSTMDCARELLQDAPNFHSSGTVKAIVLARKQLAGRGQRGRNWDSHSSGNLYATVLVEIPRNVKMNTALIGLIAGASAVDSICEVHLRHGGHIEALSKVGLKWPNDVVIDNLKAGGILTELHAGSGDTQFAAVGLGINLTSLPVSADIARNSTSLLASEIYHLQPDQQVLWFTRTFTRLVLQLETFGMQAILRRWSRWDASTGRVYTTVTDHGAIKGTANGLGPQGELSLLLDDGTVLLVTSASSLNED